MATHKKQKTQTKTNAILYGVSGIFLLLAAGVMFVNRAQAEVHPTPRAEASQAMLMSPERYSDAPYVADTYRMAADIRTTLDGLYCYCHCKDGGHYSLLDCFRDDHGAGCDICLESVRIAHKMQGEGKSIDQIRAQIDAQFSEGHTDG